MQNPYVDHNNPFTVPFRIAKLQALLKRHNHLIIGVDYDNTLRGYNSGEYYNDIIELVQRAKAQGHIICIWTANTSPDDVKKDLASIGIEHDYFNESPLFNDGRKPHFNILLDDVAGLHESYHTLDSILKGQL